MSETTTFQTYFLDRSGDVIEIENREKRSDAYVLNQNNNYFAGSTKFIDVTTYTSNPPSAINCNAANVFLAVARCTFSGCANNAQGACIYFNSPNGAIYIDKSTVSGCFSCKNGGNAQGQFVYAVTPNMNLKSTTMSECAPSGLFDNNNNECQRPFYFEGNSNVENVNVTNSWNDYCGGFALSGTAESVKFINLDGITTKAVIIELTLSNNPTFSHINVNSYSIKVPNDFSIILLHNTQLEINDITFTNTQTENNATVKLFSSGDQASSLTLKNFHIDNTYINMENVLTPSEPESSTVESPSEVESPDVNTDETKVNTDETKVNPDETKVNPDETKVKPNESSTTTTSSGSAGQEEPGNIGSLSKQNFIIVVCVCGAVLLILIILIVVFVVRRRSDTKSDSFSASSADPAEVAQITAPPTSFPTETVTSDKGMWTTNAPDEEDPFKPDLDPSSSSSDNDGDSSVL